ncbi:DUF21 domain-containing protein [Endozoicomonas sp. SM1973]|uniref:DUF21 domain-containing protein n=1 Tax=Spartinivicinus marinus TaxID=2994442 RepID=A0A853IG02_9GAMM|nr:DUF21 domain-containing protein [Spartinivicinus marinus]MCX4027771.1 DUF21 domain-containing protein [Spartinivicinus marinus]NYZ68954.1 DUF21 domain-containing protein [Spartinivicinus marinus]
MDFLIGLGILVCITQSAMFSGLNLAFFSITRLRLEIEAAKGNEQAKQVLALRKDSNRLLATILWGNVGVNVLLTLLSDNLLAGVAAFLFSTVAITILGEIMPQAYFSRHAIKAASFFSPVLRFYQVLLYPVATPTGKLLDCWIGPESINYFKEDDFYQLIKLHITSFKTDISHIEGTGVINFLALDDIPVKDEGEIVSPKSIIALSFKEGKPVFPDITCNPDDPFLRLLNSARKKWIIIVDETQTPQAIINAYRFTSGALFDDPPFDPISYVLKPLIIKDNHAQLGYLISQWKAWGDLLVNDVILLWGTNKRIVTGSDILGRLLEGIISTSSHKPTPEQI